MARVLLIRPPLTPEELFDPGTDDGSTLNPPLGIAYIAAYLRERGRACSILDGWAAPTSIDARVWGDNGRYG